MRDPQPPDLIVTCALIRQGRRLLCTQRSEFMSLPLKWEFPGGKLEPDEDPANCVVREITEELSLNIEVLGRAPSVRHPYRENAVMELIPFLARVTGGQLKLHEHKDALWCGPDELPRLDWAEADILVLQWWMETGQYLD